MQKDSITGRSVVLLACFALAAMLLWMLPLLIMGQVYDIYPLLLARNYALSGTFRLTDELGRYLAPQFLADAGVTTTVDGRLSAMLFAWISRFIRWENFIGWGFVSAGTMALSLFAWWCTVFRLFGRRIAWISMVLIAFMPLYWRQAVWLNAYNFAILFLFLSFAAFVFLRPRSHLLAVAVSGFLFGLSVASKDVFLVFLPWYAVSYAWIRRSVWKRAAGEIVLFLLIAGGIYTIPYVRDIRELGYPVNQNLAAFWPGAKDVREGFYLHLYPDPYTYYFDREAYDTKLLSAYRDFTPLQKLRQQKIFINFGVGELRFPVKILNGFWLFVGSIPSLFHLDTVGGAVLWLFILPGFLFLWRKQRNMAFFLAGLALSSEIIMRFGLHYARDHLMDYGWMLALFAALGISGVASAVSAASGKAGARVAAAIVVVLCVQLLQANRAIFAQRYSRTFVPQALQLAGSIDALPEEAVVALGIGGTRVEQLAQLSHRTLVPLSEETLRRLLEEGTLPEVFTLYGITHLYGFGAEIEGRVREVLPSVGELKEPTVAIASVSPLFSLFLHLVR